MSRFEIMQVENGFMVIGRNKTFVFENLKSLLTFLIEEYSDKKEKENDQSATKKM